MNVNCMNADGQTDGATDGLPVKDLQALLHAGEQSGDEGLQAGEQSPLQGQVVALVQHQQDGLHRHGGMAQQREQPRATNTETTRVIFTQWQPEHHHFFFSFFVIFLYKNVFVSHRANCLGC